MDSKRILLLFGISLSMFSYCQEQSDTLYLSKANLHLFDDLILEKHAIVFLDDFEQINENEKSKPHSDDQFIKDWLGLNAHLKIITRSYFDGLTEERKLVYLHPDCLILAGEEVTKWDIKNYEQN
ncbi:MAG: hypothetical protein IT221_06020 [Fluviicola sp.]|nr:hypothetical protein [Fluviicola sp.]